MGFAPSRLMPRNFDVSTLNSYFSFCHAFRRHCTLHKPRRTSSASQVGRWSVAGAVAAQLQASATDPVRVGGCRGRDRTDRRVLLGRLAMVCWKHPVTHQLAVYVIRHHASEQTLDGVAGASGGRWKPSNAGTMGKTAQRQEHTWSSHGAALCMGIGRLTSASAQLRTCSYLCEDAQWALARPHY